MGLSEAILMALLGLIITALVWLWRDSLTRAQKTEEKVAEINNRLTMFEAKCPGILECQKLFSGQIDRLAVNMLTEEQIDKILKKHFESFELKLINEGRMSPRRAKRSVKDDK